MLIPQISRSENCEIIPDHLPLMRAMASARLEGLFLNSPRTALVTVKLPGLQMPRIVMQVCVASNTTTTPFASNSRLIKSAI